MKARVHVFYKDSVFDPQGHTLAQSLRRVGFENVGDVRVGRVIDVELNSASTIDAKGELKGMCEKLLANPVIESYTFDILE